MEMRDPEGGEGRGGLLKTFRINLHFSRNLRGARLPIEDVLILINPFEILFFFVIMYITRAPRALGTAA